MIPFVHSTLLQFKNCFYFNGNVPRKRAHAYSTANTLSIVITPKLNIQFTAAINNDRLVFIFRHTIHHSQKFDHSFYLIKISKVLFDRTENGQTRLPGCCLSFLVRNIFSQLALDQATVAIDRNVTRYIYEVSHNKTFFINALGRRNLWTVS